MGQTVAFTRPDGKASSGYYASPAAGESAPGIVVIQEWWGVNQQIKGVAERLAQSGYRALVPDLYRGRVTLDVAEAEHLMGQLDFGAAATQDVQGAVKYLKARSAKVAVNGFCMGGALTILSAVLVQDTRRRRLLVRFPSGRSGRCAHYPHSALGPFRGAGRILPDRRCGRP